MIGRPGLACCRADVLLSSLWLLLAPWLLPGCLPEQRDNSPLPDLPDTAVADSSKDSGAPPADVTATATDSHVDVAPDLGSDSDADTAVALAKGCTADNDCAQLPAPLCQQGRCDLQLGLCKLSPMVDGTPCNSGVCVTAPTCVTGSCAGPAKNCDDGNDCTQDFCDEVKGCRNIANTTNCSDANPCTIDDHCSAGSCGGTINACADGNPCTVDSCNPNTGECTYVNGQPVGSAVPCNDGSQPACAGPGVCNGKICQYFPANPANSPCDDANPCTFDYCKGPGYGPEGCVHIAMIGGKCSDDACVSSTCVVDAAGTASCQTTPTCSNANPCKPLTGCAGGICQYKTVDDSLKQACDDGNPCTLGTFCYKAQCGGGSSLSCDDGNPCTADPACTLVDVNNPGLGCKHSPYDLGTCNDGNACTSGDHCSGGTCVAKAIGCDDSNECTDDSCDINSGCLHKASADGKPCGAGQSCQAGVCTGAP